MCLTAAGMDAMLLLHLDTASHDTIVRFVVVAAFSFVCAAWVAVRKRRAGAPKTLFGFSALMFIVFVAAVDWANGRPLYSWVSPLLG
jgi:hypothetical protein